MQEECLRNMDGWGRDYQHFLKSSDQAICRAGQYKVAHTYRLLFKGETIHVGRQDELNL